MLNGCLILSGLKSYVIYNLKKRWKRRTPIFITYTFGVFNLFHTMESLMIKIAMFMALTGAMILIDEWIKERYFFDPRDLGKLTHETLLVIAVPILLPIAIYLWRKIRGIHRELQRPIQENPIPPIYPAMLWPRDFEQLS